MKRLVLVCWLVGCSQPAPSEPAHAEPTPQPGPAHAESQPDPSPPDDFVRFVLVGDEAGCPPQASGDCHSSAELLADHTLRLDAWGEPGGGVHEATVPADAFAAALTRVRAPELVRLLASAHACPDANATETMTLVTASETRADTGGCNDAPIMDARGAMIELCTRLFPERSLVAPPF